MALNSLVNFYVVAGYVKGLLFISINLNEFLNEL